MTNEERYKSPKERYEAFYRFCKSKRCNACPLTREPSSVSCPFAWLVLEAEEEKPLPCPFCGGGQEGVIVGTDWAQVKCQVCGIETEMESTVEEAIAKWNRRIK